MARRFKSIRQKALNTTLSDVGVVVSRAVFRAAKPAALRYMAAQVGARTATIEAIAEAKAYEQLGGTEIGGLSGSAFSNQNPQNLQTLASLYETHPWVKICCAYIAGALAGIPLQVYQSRGYEAGKQVLEPDDASAVAQMFRFVNPQQSPSQLIEALASWLLLTGEGYIAFTAPGPGTPVGIPAEMYVLFSPFVEKIVSPARQVVGYRYSIGGDTAYFDVADVAHISTFSPAGRYRGQGAAVAGFQTVVTDKELRQFNLNVLRQGVHLSGVLETDNEDMNRDEAEVIRASFENQYSGTNKAAKLAVLWGGLQFSPQTILQKDIMMSEQIADNRNEIIALFGLKPELLTDKFSNKATAETVRRMAYEDTILGRWGKLIASALTSTGLKSFGSDIVVKFDASDVPALQTSLKEKIDVGARAIESGQMTINEVRTKLHHLPPVDGIEADVLLIGGSPAANAMSGGPGAAKGTALAAALETGRTSFAAVSVKAAGDRVAFHKLRSTAEKRTEAVLRSLLREMQSSHRAINSRSITNAEKLVEMENVFFFDGRKSVVKAMSESIRKTTDAQIALELAKISEVGISSAFDIKPVRSMRRLTAQEQRIRNMMGKQWTGLRRSMVEGLQGGETTGELNQRVNRFFDGAKTNAATVARTEINAAINGATSDVALAAAGQGIDVVARWETFHDEKVRGGSKSEFDHRRADGLTIIPGQELFLISGEKMEYPGDSWHGASAGNTINCRCEMVLEVRKPAADDNRGEV